MCKAFTMIELIFVIVIIGILSAVAIPRLASTRDDAKLSTLIVNSKICVKDAIGSYKGKGVVPAINSIPACQSVNNKVPGAIGIEGDFILVSGVHATVDGSYIYKGTRVNYGN